LAAEPAPVLVVDVAGADPGQHLLAVSLQGLANRDPGGPRVFLLTNPRDEEWLEYCLRLSPRPAEPITVGRLLELMRPELKGQILYDPAQAYTVNIATVLAGVRQAAVTERDLGLPTVADLRGRWSSAAEAYAWAVSNLLAECAQGRAACLPAEAVAMRDYAIQERMFVFSSGASPGEAAVQEALVHLNPGTAIYGQVPPELAAGFSRASHFVVAASQAANLSFLSRLDVGQAFHQYPRYMEPTAPRYLALIFDCSDLSFAVNEMPGLWERWSRGSLALGWALPAALLEAAPPVLHRYYADGYRSGIDGFVLGPSGAGEMDLGAATAPYAFLQATAGAARELSAYAALYTPPAPPADVGAAVGRFVTDTGVRGVFLLSARDFEPALYGGVPIVATPRVRSVEAAVSYLDRIPLERRWAALCLDPSVLSAADAAHIAAHVAGRFVVVTPQELVDLMRLPAAPTRAGQALAAVTSVELPETADPNLPIPIKAKIAAPNGVLSAEVAYRPASSPLVFYEVMQGSEGSYQAEVPPIRGGGEITLSIRALDSEGRASWSPAWNMTVPRADGDGDGLSDAEELLLLTDPKAADTDGDGLLDGGDPTPLRADQVTVKHFGPIYPPSDLPYLIEAGGSVADREGRRLRPGDACLYWLPLTGVPPGAPAVVGLEGEGPAALALSGDAASLVDEFNGELTQTWYSGVLPADFPGGAFLRVTCPMGATRELVIRGVGVFSSPEAPSLAGITVYPAHPGPEQPILVAATAFSPKRVAEVSLTYRVNGRGEITIPMRAVGDSQRYQASLPAFENREEIEWWIRVRDSEGGEAATVPEFLPIGARGRESVSLIATRDFLGEWLPCGDWSGAGRMSGRVGARDSADANLTGGTYTIWILAGGRGQGIGLYVGDQRVGGIDPDRPDGWQQVGRVRLEAGRHHLHLVLEPARRGPVEGMPRYAAVIVTADPTFRPPADRVLDIYNSLVLLSPRDGDTLTGRVELRATGAGNVTAAEFSLDGQLLRRVTGPPFVFSLNTARITNGPHTLKVEGFNRAGTAGLELAVQVTVAN
jgi:hypothetical protein